MTNIETGHASVKTSRGRGTRPFCLLCVTRFKINSQSAHSKQIINPHFSSLIINCTFVEFFCCFRSVRQGGLLSLILVCISKVLSRSLSNIVVNGKIDYMRGPRGIFIPSYVLFAKEILNQRQTTKVVCWCYPILQDSQHYHHFWFHNWQSPI